MTDNEIIKALRLCAIDSDVCSDACPYYEEREYFDGECIKQRTLDAIDLINRQKAEIEELRCHIKYAKQVYDDNGIELQPIYKIRAEAIKEFAERLKNVINEDIQSGCDCADYLTDDLPVFIDNLVKEMTEETP